jgi:ion channel-forming bestrophin family protein
LAVSLLALLIVWVDAAVIALPHTNVAIFGVALSLFLGFRNNAAYDRWWEGRRLWGQLVADMRALAGDCTLFLPDETPRHEVLRLALAFLHLHRVNLRRIADSSAAKDWSAQDFYAEPHRPCAALAERFAAIALAQAGCKRIAAAPLPYVYSLLVFRTTYLYCLLIPFALIDDAGWTTPIFVAIVALWPSWPMCFLASPRSPKSWPTPLVKR